MRTMYIGAAYEKLRTKIASLPFNYREEKGEPWPSDMTTLPLMSYDMGLWHILHGKSINVILHVNVNFSKYVPIKKNNITRFGEDTFLSAHKALINLLEPDKDTTIYE